jgi:hypothetical protein
MAKCKRDFIEVHVKECLEEVLQEQMKTKLHKTTKEDIRLLKKFKSSKKQWNDLCREKPSWAK